MKLLLSIIFCLTVLSACGNKMVLNSPETDYQKCLEKYGNDKSQCEASREEYGVSQEEIPPIDDSAADPDPGDYGPDEDPGN